MKPIETEFRRIEEIWDALETGLESQYQTALSGGTSDPAVEASLQNLAAGIAEVATRMSGFAGRQSASTPDFRRDEMRSRGRHVLDLIERNAICLRRFQAGARQSLAGVQSGEKFLHSMRGHGSPGPSFIDACQ